MDLNDFKKSISSIPAKYVDFMVSLQVWNLSIFYFAMIVSVFCYIPNLINKACHPGGHNWDYYPGVLSLSQVIATHMKIGHP